MSNPVFRFARVSGQNTDWLLKRNCSVTPAQLAWMYGALCVVSLAIGGFFWSLGAWFVLQSLLFSLVLVAFQRELKLQASTLCGLATIGN